MTSRTGLDFRLLALLEEALEQGRWQVADNLLAALEALCGDTGARALQEAYLSIERHTGESVRRRASVRPVSRA
jgi:hypothetical protein